MLRATLRFYGDLNELLFSSFSGPVIERMLPGPTSVKDLIEGCGVPHTEVDLILCNGDSVPFSHLIDQDTQVSVYPVFNSIALPDEQHLQPSAAPANRFLADANLGKLARYLRMAGFDTAYVRQANDGEIITRIKGEQRILLSRDRKLLMHKVITYGYLPRSDVPGEQLLEIFRRYNLYNAVRPFTRCPNCNGRLQSVSKEEVIDQLEPLTKKYFHDFSKCANCGQVYWAGSHRRRLSPAVKKLLGM